MAWRRTGISLDGLNALNQNTLGETLGMQFTEITEDTLTATMPVDHRTRQPFGLLHGGASVALAETLGSVASTLMVDTASYNCVGMEINANHLRSAREGLVTGTCRAIHIGRTTHVWHIEIRDERERLLCISRLTVAIIKK
jgi:1,4-dihydroxy-2-naphthoyl-CoA hydrolase